MGDFDSTLRDLSALQSRLKITVNQIWSIKFSLAQAYNKGHGEHDFLPRRLTLLRKELECNFEKYLHQLNRLITDNLSHHFIVFDSASDVRMVMRIRTKIRYLQNAFAGHLPLVGETLAKLNTALPRA